MTREDYEFLASHEAHFKRALESNYCRYIPRNELLRMGEIYKAQNPTARVNLVCARCKLQLLKDVGRMYFAERVRLEAELKNKVHGSKRKKQAEFEAETDELGVGEGAPA